MALYYKNEILALIICVWLNANNTKGISDPYASITFENETQWVICEHHVGIALFIFSIQFDL
jgi:hypothetical protein